MFGFSSFQVRSSKVVSMVCLATGLLLATQPAQAAIVYSENFNSGAYNSNWTADNYWLNGNDGNGIIANGGPSGSGFYLLEQTGGGGPGGVAPADRRFFVSSTFAVAANSNYSLHFDLINTTSPAIYYAPIKAEINGVNLGTITSGASPHTWDTGSFTFNWNSGASTTAQIALFDMFNTVIINWGFGNDFGIDNFTLSGPAATPAPVPGALALLGLGLAGLAATRRKRA